MSHQLSAGRIYICLHLVHWSFSLIPIFSHSIHRALGNSPMLLTTFAKGCAFTGMGTTVELDPFSETNCYVSFERLTNHQIHSFFGGFELTQIRQTRDPGWLWSQSMGPNRCFQKQHDSLLITLKESQFTIQFFHYRLPLCPVQRCAVSWVNIVAK